LEETSALQIPTMIIIRGIQKNNTINNPFWLNISRRYVPRKVIVGSVADKIKMHFSVRVKGRICGGTYGFPCKRRYQIDNRARVITEYESRVSGIERGWEYPIISKNKF
jgi:hypothetical protein